MKFFLKNGISFFLFIVFVFLLSFSIFSKPTVAATVYCYTPCNEKVNCGSTSSKGCDWECVTCYDEEGNPYPCHCGYSYYCTQYTCSNSYTVYRANNTGCKAMIEKGICQGRCSGDGYGCCTCGGCELKCEKVADCEQCGSWQKAERAGCTNVTLWGQTKPECKCKGSCVKAPTGLRHYNNPNYPTDPCNPEPGVSGLIKLPVKLDWDDVEGWKDGWCSDGGHQIVDTCGLPITPSSTSANTVNECIKEKIDACIAERTAEEQAKPEWNNLSCCQKRCTLTHIESECHENFAFYQKECIQLCYDYSPTPPYYTPKPCTSEPAPSPSPECPAATGDCPYPNLVYNPSQMVQYYELTIQGEMRDANGSAMSVYTTRLDKSEFIPPNPCFFKSNRTYTWSVKACCGNGECGPPATSTFTTSLAPEPIWPYDPDWAGPDRAEPRWPPMTEENPYPVHLEWCEVEEAQSYCLRFYKPGTPFIRMYGQGEPFCPILYSELYCPSVVPPEKDFPIQTFFDFGLDVFTKETDYQWKIATCLNQYGYKCGLDCPNDKICYTFETLKSECGCCDFSQLWNFYGVTTLLTPELVSPKNGEFVNFTHSLEWKHVPGANSYLYEIKRGSSVIIKEPIIGESISIKSLWEKGILAFNTQYSWRVQPCWDQEGKNCEKENWSNEWSFTVSGAPPTQLQTDATIIPVKLDWKDIPGALSYYYEVATDNTFGNIVMPEEKRVLRGDTSEVLVDYPFLVQNTDYYWKVKTCIDEKGEVCGNWSAINSFKTFKLGKPTDPYPPDGADFYTYERYLRWNEVLGARAYQYEVLTGVKTIALTKVPTNSAYVDTPRELGVGEHSWHVRACLDENCQEVAEEFSDEWHFNVVEKEPPGGGGGLVPCGRDVNLADPYGVDETERCGLQHVFVLLRNILDFALWEIGLIILVILAITSGIIFYFSGYISEQIGVSDPISKVKSLWKAAGIGYLVIFLAYTFINIFLAVFGYKIGVFGPWWVISF